MADKNSGKYKALKQIEVSSESDVCCTAIKVSLDLKSEENQSLLRVLSALGDATRLGIIEMLSGMDEPVCVCDIVSQFDLGQPTISHHLKVLREAGLVHWEKRGLWVYYAVNSDTLKRASTFLAELAPAQPVAGLPA